MGNGCFISGCGLARGGQVRALVKSRPDGAIKVSQPARQVTACWRELFAPDEQGSTRHMQIVHQQRQSGFREVLCDGHDIFCHGAVTRCESIGRMKCNHLLEQLHAPLEVKSILIWNMRGQPAM